MKSGRRSTVQKENFDYQRFKFLKFTIIKLLLFNFIKTKDVMIKVSECNNKTNAKKL